MGHHHGFNIGSFFKDVGHRVQDVVQNPAQIIPVLKTVAQLTPLGVEAALASQAIAVLPGIVKTVEPFAKNAFNTVSKGASTVFHEGEDLIGKGIKGIEGFASSLMMPLMIGGGLVVLFMLKK